MLRLLAALCLLITIGIGVYDVFNHFGRGEDAGFRLSGFGELWSQIHLGSLQQLDVLISRDEYLGWPNFWLDYVQPYVLGQPAVLIFAVLAILFFLLHLLFSAIFRRKQQKEEGKRRSNTLIRRRR